MKSLCAVAVACAFSSGLAWGAPPPAGQLPTGANVRSGAVTIAQDSNVLNISQSSDKGIINWQTFSIGQGAQVNFIQPGSTSATLNRVVSSEPSSIFGQLNANGQVYLINPNGIVVGPSGQINANGLVLSTSDITDTDFLAGNNSFAPVEGGSISIDGSIAVGDGGLLTMAPEVTLSVSANLTADSVTFNTPLTTGSVVLPEATISTTGNVSITGSDITLSGTVTEGNLPRVTTSTLLTVLGSVPPTSLGGNPIVTPTISRVSPVLVIGASPASHWFTSFGTPAGDHIPSAVSPVLQATGQPNQLTMAKDGTVALGFNPVTVNLD